MDSFLQADLFFFITTIAVVILVGVLVGVLVYFLAILKDLKYVSRRVREQTDQIIQALDSLRKSLKTVVKRWQKK